MHREILPGTTVNTILLSIVFFLCCSCNATFDIQVTNEGMAVEENDKKVLFYQLNPKTVSGKYERAGYIHPLYDLNENILTEDGPEDHPYHRGVFWAWHQLLLDSVSVANGWISENIAYTVQQSNFTTSKDSITLSSHLIWKQVNGGDTLADLVQESTSIIIHRSTQNYRLIDFDIRLRPLLPGIAIGGAPNEKEYGGFCIRLLLPPDIRFTAEDTTLMATETPVMAGPWMNFSGQFYDRDLPSGVAVFTPMPFPGPQQQWILRKKNSMQNIVFPGKRAQLLPEEGWRLRYRLVVYNQPMPPQTLQSLYDQYVNR